MILPLIIIECLFRYRPVDCRPSELMLVQLSLRRFDRCHVRTYGNGWVAFHLKAPSNTAQSVQRHRAEEAKRPMNVSVIV